MKRSIKYQIIAILILITLAVLDAFSVFVPIVAIIAIAILLFKPKWFANFVKYLYEEY